MLMDRYTLLQKIGIYVCIAIFMTFILLPFFEMFRTSLSPMSHLFHAPYELWSDEFSFDAYYKMWDKVPTSKTFRHTMLQIKRAPFMRSFSARICQTRYSQKVTRKVPKSPKLRSLNRSELILTASRIGSLPCRHLGKDIRVLKLDLLDRFSQWSLRQEQTS